MEKPPATAHVLHMSDPQIRHWPPPGPAHTIRLCEHDNSGTYSVEFDQVLLAFFGESCRFFLNNDAWKEM